MKNPTNTDKHTVRVAVIEHKQGLSTRNGKADLIKVLPMRQGLGPAIVWVNEGQRNGHPWQGCKVGETLFACLLEKDPLTKEQELAPITEEVFRARNAS